MLRANLLSTMNTKQALHPPAALFTKGFISLLVGLFHGNQGYPIPAQRQTPPSTPRCRP
jgi:hypothetical protein